MADNAFMAQRIIIANPTGLIHGRIVEVVSNGYGLLVEVEADKIAAPEDVRALAPRGLENWTTAVPTMYEWDSFNRAGVMVKIANCFLEQDVINIDNVCLVVDDLCQIIHNDLSGEMRGYRQMLYENLMQTSEPRLHEAADHLLEACQRMGGDHVMTLMGEWLKVHLPEQKCVRTIIVETPYKVTVAEVEEQAKALPRGLYQLWNEDPTLFVKVLYGMRLSNVDVRRVLSCLVWLQVMNEDDQLEEPLSDDYLNPIVDEIAPIFFDDRLAADAYLKAIAKMKPTEITAYTKKLIAANRISPERCRRDLWHILHEHGLYPRSESNWNQQI